MAQIINTGMPYVTSKTFRYSYMALAYLKLKEIYIAFFLYVYEN